MLDTFRHVATIKKIAQKTLKFVLYLKLRQLLPVRSQISMACRIRNLILIFGTTIAAFSSRGDCL